MKLILTAEVDNLGVAGDVVDVRDGYGRNYLIPRGFGIAWTKGAGKQIEGIKRARDARAIRGLEHAQQVRDQLEQIAVEVPVKASPEGKLFGSVTSAAIATAIKKAGGPAIDKRSIQISKSIKSLGAHSVGVKLHDSVTAKVGVSVVADA